MQPLIGILGGMGPLAAVDFTRKILDETVTTSEQQHVPVLLWNVPQIPDRQIALSGIGESPLPAMLQGIAVLNAAGATRIAIPCNTAHYWFDELAAASAAPLFHIVDATLALVGNNPGTIGILATRGALQAGIYQQRLTALDLTYVTNTEDELDQLFMPGCYAIKNGQLERGGNLLQQAAEQLIARGADTLLLACTEVALGLEHLGSALLPRAIDTNRALAKTCVRYWQDHSAKPQP